MAETASLLPLFVWLSSGYPVGAYAYSHGLEAAVDSGDVSDEASLERWLADVLEIGAGRNDAILLAAAHRSATASGGGELVEINDLALATAPSRELRLETGQQGRSFLETTLASWPHPKLESSTAGLAGEVAYPVAIGISAACHEVALPPTLETYLLAFMQNLVSAAIRLGVVGQTGGTRVVAGLSRRLPALAREVLGSSLDDLGSATFRADLGSFLHETQYSRLFRS